VDGVHILLVGRVVSVNRRMGLRLLFLLLVVCGVLLFLSLPPVGVLWTTVG
jgi:hypothetical protein